MARYAPWVAYQGYEPQPGATLARESVDGIAPQRLWDEYICQRRPCIIRGFPRDEEWKADKWRDLDHLADLAGHVPVKVEPIHPKLGHFGTAAKRTTVPFGDYVASLKRAQDDEQEGVGEFYLTTQYDDLDDERGDDDDDESSSEGPARKRKRSSSTSSSSASSSGADSSSSSTSSSPSHLDASLLLPEPLDRVLPSPTHALARTFPVHPTLMGNLVLQQTNLWLGSSKEGKSSGLHHDFHDNLYALVRGRKRFLLFPPTAFKQLHPRGNVERVHHNGLIEYTPRAQDPSEGEVLHVDDPRSARLPLRPDGLPPSEAARWRLVARKDALRRAEEEAAASCGEGGVPREKRKGKARMPREQEEAERKVEEARREALAIARFEGEVEDDEELESDEDEDDEEGFFAALGGMDENSSDDDEGDDSSEGEGDLQLQMALEKLARRAARGDASAAEALRRLIDENDEDEEQDDTDDEGMDDSDEDALSSSSSNGATRRSPPLIIPSHYGRNLPGGLRRDDGQGEEGEDFFDDDEDGVGFDDFAANPELLLDDEDGEGGIATEEIDAAAEAEAAEEELRAMAALRSEVMRRMARAAGGGAAARREDVARSRLRSVHGSGASRRLSRGDDDEDEEDEEEPGEDDSEEDEDEVADDNDDSDDAEEEERLERMLAAHRQGLIVDDDFENLPVEDEDEDDDDDDSDSEGDSWGSTGGFEDGEAALAALAAQAQDSGYQDDDKSSSSDSGSSTASSSSSSSPSSSLEPLSFSLIPPAILHAHFGLDDSLGGTEATSSQGDDASASSEERSKLYPLRGKRPPPGCPAPLVAKLQEGEMLYLPAGWWHEVTSQAAPARGDGSGGDGGVHMALNWWFHPPDNLLPSSSPTVSDGDEDEELERKQPRGKRARGHLQKKGKTGGGSGSGSGSGTATPSGHGGTEASSGAAVVSNSNGGASGGGGFAQPYRDGEVWDHLRQEVQRLVDEAIALGDVDRRHPAQKVGSNGGEKQRTGRGQVVVDGEGSKSNGKKGKKRVRGE